MRLFVSYAHPDDESFGPSAILAECRASGASLHGLWLTRGGHGQAVDAPPAPDDLARLREQDLREAAALIGFQSIEILDYPDGALASQPPDQLATEVLERLRRLRPDVVFTFGPAGMTGHADHIAVHRATVAAFHQALAEGLPVRELYFDAVPPAAARHLHVETEPDGRPNTWVPVSEAAQAIKRGALAIHARHVADARERLAGLQRDPLPREPLHRAWPPVPEGVQVDRFLPLADRA